MTNLAPIPDGQARLIACDDRLILAIGGPGSGKTRAALLLAKRLLETEPAGSGRNVLFLTFSRAATGELIARTPGLISAELRHRLEITTFHSYARTILESFGRFAGLGTGPITIASPSEAKLGLSPAGSLTFDQLVPRAVSLLRANRWIRECFARRLIAVISDEFQDTGADQSELLTLLSEHSRLVCLADPDQMIYDFRPDVSAQRIAELRALVPIEISLEERSHRDPTGLIPRVARAVRTRRFDDLAFREARDAGRLRIQTNTDPLWEGVVDEVRTLRVAGQRSVGVFVTQRVMVEELGRELGAAGIEHEVAGLDGAAGEAEVAIGAMARYATGQGSWDEVCQRLAVFLTSAQPKHSVPVVAQMLVNSRSDLPGFLPERLGEVQAALDKLESQPIAELFALADGFKRLFAWGDRLWRTGSRDLASQLSTIAREPLTEAMALTIDSIALRRQGDGYLDDLGTARLPVRLMTTFQAKGREMDAIVLVHHPGDIIKASGFGKLQRVHFVAISRARHIASIVLPPYPDPFMAPYATLGR